MIGALKGKPQIFNSNSVIMMVNGVGYKVFVTTKMIQAVQKTTLALQAGKDMLIYTHTHVREDLLELYGFETPEQLNLFELLIGISGIGPKTAISILEKGDKEIKNAIVSSDVDFFTSIPRIGKKNAQRIIIELKPKLGSINDLDLKGEIGGQTKEVTDALISFGFRRYEISEALKNLPKNLTSSEEKIKGALKLLGKGK